VRDLLDGGHLAPVPRTTTTQLAFGMLSAAGQALSAAAPADRPRIKAEYLDVISRLLVGLRT